MRFFYRSFRRLGALLAAAAVLGGCGGGGGGGGSSPVTTPVPTAQPSPVPSSTPGTTADYSCPTSDSTAGLVAAGDTAGEAVGRMMPRADGPAQPSGQLVAVSYDARTMTAGRAALGARETALGARLSREYAFIHTGLVTRVLAVAPGQAARVAAALRQTPGVRSVGLTGAPRFATSVATPYYPIDPYFTGFATTVAPPGGTPPPATFEIGPLVESADVPGQWDMHVTRLEYAFGYSQPNNGSGLTDVAALGSAAVKIAVIDTGADTTHPELASKIAYQHCFITNAFGTQSQSGFTTDQAGHGTDVAGIAGAAAGNGLGFAGVGGKVTLYAYRVFPTPDDNCAKDSTTDPRCTANTNDIAAAINDAVAHRVNVISLSLGGGACQNGGDPDPVEGAAVADAVAANIIVVAAAGNGAGPPLRAPACDPGVIAVGATSLADGTTNGSRVFGGSPSAPFEYVATYTDYGSPGAIPGSAAAWGIVAPGGDPNGGGDSDDLHWIENIWTSTPFIAKSGDRTFVGNCAGDYPNETGPIDCRILIAGTSMATPHVAGAAALILAVNPAYQSPALMKQLLCSTADDIRDGHEGCGRLDVYRAMATALGDPSLPGPSPSP